MDEMDQMSNENKILYSVNSVLQNIISGPD